MVFARSVSLNLITRVLFCIVKEGWCSSGGDIRMFSVGLFRVKNSSNVIFIMGLEIRTLPLTGSSLSILGGVVSCGPPVGVTIFAHAPSVRDSNMNQSDFLKGMWF